MDKDLFWRIGFQDKIVESDVKQGFIGCLVNVSVGDHQDIRFGRRML